jgi:hypothetical protein
MDQRGLGRHAVGHGIEAVGGRGFKGAHKGGIAAGKLPMQRHVFEVSAHNGQFHSLHFRLQSERWKRE